MKFTLRQLQIFLAVARHQNISKAAEHLHMSQSAASEALLNLEHSYEISLFDRVSNKLAMNAIGQTIRTEAENLLSQCQRFEAVLKDHKEVGHIKVGASFTIGNHLATRYLAGYLASYPDADVELDIANTPDVVAKVLNFEVDIGMIEGADSQIETALDESQRVALSPAPLGKPPEPEGNPRDHGSVDTE